MLSQTSAMRAVRRWTGLLAIASFAVASAPAWAQSEQKDLVNAAETTFSNLMRDPDMTWLQSNIGRARGVLIAPSVVKAGWIFGGSGGRAVLFARDDRTGRWSGPAFYNLGAASVGFQAGVAVSETVALVMTEKGLNSLLASSAKLGADVSVAAGPVGAGTASAIASDLVAYSRSKGVYGGFNLEGSVIAVADNWNRDYYGTGVLPTDILVRANVHNPQADRLVAELQRAASGTKTSAAR